MASRRDSSPSRYSPHIPRGPRGSGGDASYFQSDSWKPPRDYQDRPRSRSRSPGSDRRRPSERDDPYEYGKEVRRRANENYRPRYDDTPTRSSIKDPRCPSSVTSGHSSPLSRNEPGLPPKNTSSGLPKPQEERATSWHNRAMNAPVSAVATKMPSPLSEEVLTETAQAVGAVFIQLINEATVMSALKSQEHNAKKRADRRVSEYEKSKGHHDKFPSIKDSQTASKVEAEKELKIISAKVNEKQSSLQKLATEAVEKLIPTLLARGGGNSAKQEDLQTRVKILEGKCEEDEKKIEDQVLLLAEQRKAIQILQEKHQALTKTVDEKHQALKKTLEGTHNDLTNALRTTQGQSSATQKRLEVDMARVDGTLQELKNSQQAIESLKNEFPLVKKDVAKILKDNGLFSSELKAHMHNIQTLFSRVKELDEIRTELKNIGTNSHATTKNIEKQIKTLNEDLSKQKQHSNELLNHMTDLAHSQKTFRDSTTTLNTRVDDLEKRPDSAKLDARLQKLEKNPSRDTSDFVTRKDLENLKDRVKQVERIPPEPQHPLPAEPGSKSLDERVDFLEKAAQSTFPAKPNPAIDMRITALEQADNARKTLEANIDERVKGVEVGLSNLRSKEIAEVKKHIAALDIRQPPAPLIASTSTSNPQPSSGVSTSLQPQLHQISARIQTVEDRIQMVKDAQDTHDEMWTDVLNEQVQEESQKLQARISTLETTFSQLSNRLETHQHPVFDNDTVVNETASKVVTIFKTNPEYLPSKTSTGFDTTQRAALLNEAITNVIATLKDKPDILPFPTERSTFYIHQILNQSLVPMQTSLEATNLSLGNLQARVDNINTLELSRHALGQLYELHPDLGKIEATIGDFKTELARRQADFETGDKQIDELSKKVNGLQGVVQNLEANVQDRQTAESMTQQYQELRKEVDTLTDDGMAISQKVKALYTDLDTFGQGVTSLQQENEASKKDFAIKFAQLRAEVDEKMDKAKEAPARPSPAVSQRSNTTNGSIRGPRPSSSSIANRQPSVSSVNSNNKKRKLDSVLSAKTNGVRPHLGSPQGKKRQRKTFGEDDPEADPDYNEDIPEPGVSTDEDRKPPRNENERPKVPERAKAKVKAKAPTEIFDLVSDSNDDGD
ncbi:hypothetical protein N431DRAFT_234062 [Stipitochalara longipes BDJ]|nr:hypothetical protein N431DRAFT_234062 [Stipitochalara longipes BDJ]